MPAPLRLSSTRAVISLAASLLIASPAMAQLMPPTPPRVDDSRTYAPVGKTMAPPTAPARPANQAGNQVNPNNLSIVSRDAAGDIVRIAAPYEATALARMPFDTAKRAAIAEALSRRLLQIDSAVNASIGAVATLKKQIAELPEDNADSQTLQSLMLSARQLRFDDPATFLLKMGAISEAEFRTAKAIAEEYRKALQQEVLDELGHDPSGDLFKAAFELNVLPIIAESDASVERRIVSSAGYAVRIMPTLSLTPKQTEQFKTLLGTDEDPAKLRAGLRSAFWTVLTPAQQSLYLKAVDAANR